MNPKGFAVPAYTDWSNNVTTHKEISVLAGHTVIVRDKGSIEVEDYFDRVTGVDFEDEGDVLFGYHTVTGEPFAFFVEEIEAQ